ncbi:MAG: TRAP transporter substrate-binding protein [Deltaproteobacteria bacterium]|nr:TRAP transporter substrate-binding protein [Deltaproteobacteria bacterium]
MKHKRLVLWLFGIFFVMFGTTMVFVSKGEAASDKAIKLSFSNIFPRAHLQSELNQLFCDEIAKRTNGRVEITLYPAGTLTSAPKNFEGVVKGLSDIGMSCPLYVAGRFPVSEIFEMPSNIDSGWVTSKVYNDLHNKFDLEEYKDVHVLYMHGPGRNVLSTRSVPIRKLSDMKGLVLRASGGATSTITAFGATPRALPMGDAYAALSKGVVEGQFAVPETLKGWKHGDVVKYVTIPPVSTSSCQYVVINKKKWDSLPPDIQKIFNEVSANFPDYHGYVWEYYDKIGLEYFQSLPGREIIVLPNDQRAEWEAAVAPVIDKYIKDKTAMGLPAKAMLDYFNERVEYWTTKKPSIDISVQWVEKNLLTK